jgi:predicted kinase
MDAETYRRNAELLFSADLDDERSMAAMRGALAAGKRVPSKEALAALEIVKLEDLEENGRSTSSFIAISKSTILTAASLHHLLQRVRCQQP